MSPMIPSLVRMLTEDRALVHSLRYEAAQRRRPCLDHPSNEPLGWSGGRQVAKRRPPPHSPPWRTPERSAPSRQSGSRLPRSPPLRPPSQQRLLPAYPPSAMPIRPDDRFEV